MQRKRKVAGNKLPILYLVLLSATFFATCKDNEGPVGGGIISVSDIKNDTLAVSGFNKMSFDGYSGKLDAIPLGKYDDQLFGTFEAIGYIKPAIQGVNPDTLVRDGDYSMYLELSFDTTYVYGDTLAATDFNIYKITENWRGYENRLSDQVQYDDTKIIASFSRTKEDSMRIKLDDEWMYDYADILNDTSSVKDSTYYYGFYGLAIVPGNASTNISYSLAKTSRFYLISETQEDTVLVGLNDWDYALMRDNVNEIPDRLTLINTLESLYNFKLKNKVENFGNENLLKAELLIYEDVEQLNNTLPNSHIRSEVLNTALRFGYTEDLDFDLYFFDPHAWGTFDKDLGAYRFDITSLINAYLYDNPPSDEIYLNLSPADGLLRSTILYGENAPDELKPKLILTTIDKEGK